MKNLFILITFGFFLGCAPDHTYKYFDFIDSDSNVDVGILSIGLRGKFILVDPSEKMKITHKGNPYEFWIWFETDKEKIKRIEVSNIVISSKSGGIMHELTGGEITPTWSDYKKAYTGAWYQKGIQLNHVPLIVEFTAKITHGNETMSKKISSELDTSYKEEMANDFWSKLMSV